MRTTGIKLVAETGQFNRQMRESAKVTADTAAQVDNLGQSSDRTGRQVDDLGGDFRDTSRDAQKLQDEIQGVERSLAGLAAEFVATSSASDRLDLTKSIRKQQGQLRQLLKVQKLLPSAAEMQPAGRSFSRGLALVAARAGPEAATGFAAKFSEQLGPLIAKTPLSGPLGLAAAGAAVLVVPLIGATISGAVIGGAGVGGVIGGLMLAARDQRVKNAGKMLGQVMLEDLETRAQRSFIDPMLASISRVNRGFAGMGGDLERIFSNSSRFLLPLTNGAIAFLQRFTSGFADLTDAAGPVIDVISQGMADLGHQIGSMFSSLKDNGVDAAVALRVVFKILQVAIEATGIALNVLTETFGFLAKIGAFGRDAQIEYIRLTANANIAADANRNAATSLMSVREQGKSAATGLSAVVGQAVRLAGPIGAAARASDAHARAMRGELGAMKDLNTATREMIDPLFAFTEAQKRVRQAQDQATEAIKKHGRNSVEAREATRKLASAALDLQGKAGGLAQGFNGKLTPSMRATFQAARLTEDQINDVERQLIEARKAADKYDGRYNANVTATGVPKVKQALSGLLIMQQALKKGVPASAIAATNKNVAQGFAGGGWTGYGSKLQPAGTVHADEFVVQKDARQPLEASKPGALDYMNRTGQWPGYGAGGLVMPFPTTASRSRIPSRGEAAAVIAPRGGPTLSFIVSAVRSAFPGMALLSGYRPGSRTLSGNLSYHAMRRAADFPASRPMAQWWNLRYKGRTKEFISPWNDLNILNGRRHAYSGAVYRQHNFAGGNAHNHVAMKHGGVIREPVFGYGASGRSYSFAENGPETVTPGTGGRGGGNTIVYVQAGYVVSEQQLQDKIASTIDKLHSRGRI